MNKKRLLTVLSLVLLTALFSVSCMLFMPSGEELKFDPDQLPDASVGVPYDVEIHVTQNRTPVGDFSISDGALPAGLQLKKVEDVEDTARITGIPTEAGTFPLNISV